MRRNDYIASLMLGAAALLREDSSDPDIEIFLGGTCNNSTWREYIIPRLNIKYFNPVVDNWTAKKIRQLSEKSVRLVIWYCMALLKIKKECKIE